MRLSDLLSKEPNERFQQVDNFTGTNSLTMGKPKRIVAGAIYLNLYCKKCNDIRTFQSDKELFCIPVKHDIISIDCRLKCADGDTCVPVWFLVETEDDFTKPSPKIRISKRIIKYTESVSPDYSLYGDEYSALLEKAERAYQERLGAGAIIYLRKVLELIIFRTAESKNIPIQKDNGNTRPFRHVLDDVDRLVHIIPSEFADDGYRLFGELSDVVHGEYDENVGLTKYGALRRLVIGVLDKVKNSRELREAIGLLGWDENGGK